MAKQQVPNILRHLQRDERPFAGAPPPSQSLPPSQSPPPSNYSVVDMELTPTAPSLMQQYLLVHASETGDLWCHQESCAGTYQPYRVNIWGLRNTEENREESRLMLPQQVTNILRHLEKVHGIPKHEVVEDVLPWGTPFPR